MRWKAKRLLGLLLVVLLAGTCLAEDQGEQVQQVQFSLEQAVAYALNHNPRLRAALARVEGAQSSFAAAQALQEPVATLSASARLQQPIQEIRPTGSPTAIGVTRRDPRSATFRLVWPLWTGGRVRAARGLARSEVSAQEADLQQTVEQLVLEVGLAFYSVLDAEEQLRAGLAQVEEAREKLRFARVALASGYATPSEVALAEAAEQQASEAVSAGQSALDYSRRALNTVLGRAIDLPIQPQSEVVDLGNLPELDAAYKLALERRPELLALEYRTESARYAVERARAEKQPQLGLLGQCTLQAPTDTMPNHQELIGLELSWPFSNPVSSANVEVAKAGALEVAALQEQLQQGIRLQVAEAARKVADAAERYATAQKGLEAAGVAAARAQAAYAAGTLLKRDLLTANSALARAEAGFARASYGLDAANLYYARALGVLRELLYTGSPEGEAQ